MSALPHTVVPVATAIPAFIGYTPRASRGGESLVNRPVRIESMREYLAYFGAQVKPEGGGAPIAGPPSAQYSPVYYPVAAASGGRDVRIGGADYVLSPDAGTLYYLYNAIRFFYENGGGTAYVVSVGGYGQGIGGAAPGPAPHVNPNVQLNDLTGALASLEEVAEVTMIVVPEATLLSAANNATLMQQVLQHCGLRDDRVALFDVLGGARPDPQAWQQDIADFRTGTGTNFLRNGVAYYPFLETTLVQAPDVSFENVGGGLSTLGQILPGAGKDPLRAVLARAAAAQTRSEVRQAELALLRASPDYARLQAALLAKINVQPPSAAMAGIYTLIDETQGVWKAPANVSVVGATAPTIRLTDAQQAPLNVDASTGKSINAIRLFPGRGILVWGARTLDGNSAEWRYVSVRRTAMMIEQSAKLALAEFVFEPNDASTWAAVASMLNSFLTELWRQGAFAGATPDQAFTVQVGLGSTMTANDILNGIMRVIIGVSLTHPAEFTIITISQEMADA